MGLRKYLLRVIVCHCRCEVWMWWPDLIRMVAGQEIPRGGQRNCGIGATRERAIPGSGTTGAPRQMLKRASGGSRFQPVRALQTH